MFSSRAEFWTLFLLAVIAGVGVSVPRLDNGTDAGAPEVVQNEEPAEEPVVEEPAVEEPVEEPAEIAPPIVQTMRFDGATGVVSGTAMPGADVMIKYGDEVVASGQADADGNYAMTFDYETPAEGGILQLVQIDPDGNEIPAEEALTVLPLDDGDTTTATLTDEGVEVEPSVPEVQELALGNMSYGSNTPWVLGGSAAANAVIDLFVDGEKIGTTNADENGNWTYQGEGVQPGTYELGLAQNGEAPITQSITLKDEPVEVTQSDGSADGSSDGASTGGEAATTAPTVTVGDREYVVQRGDSLWRIAERFYGEGQGYRYTEIFDENSPEIRNPDLIYPEQNLDIPKGN